jgi:hypothetical protein
MFVHYVLSTRLTAWAITLAQPLAQPEPEPDPIEVPVDEGPQ